jgi:Tol biopolymer transport system component
VIKKRFFSVFVALLFAGCSTNSGQSMPTSTSNSLTSMPPSLSAVTLTSNPGKTITENCLTVEQNETSLRDVASGTILLFPISSESPAILMDVNREKKYELPSIGDGQVSLDGDKFAYIEQPKNDQNETTVFILWVVDARANVLSKIKFDQNDEIWKLLDARSDIPIKSPMDKNFYLGQLRWLDNERVILTTDTYSKLLVVHPFTGLRQVVSNELPLLDMFSFPGGPWWRVEYSPDLQWVAYAYDEAGVSPGIIVRDVVSQKDLWKSPGGEDNRPVWSPNGKDVAVVGEGQLYLVDRYGDAKPVLPIDVRQQVASPSWSPDGRYIAFWNSSEQATYSLIIYEIQTGKLTNYCITNPYHDVPLWSPNSQQVIVNKNVDTGSILIDLPQKAAYKIQELPNTTILGWMNSLP